MAKGQYTPGVSTLSPTADATLVDAAYKAAMGNVPTDMGADFRAMAAGYETSMARVGEAYAEMGKVAGELAKGAYDAAVENRKMDALGRAYDDLYKDPNSTDNPVGYFTGQLEALKLEKQAYKDMPFGAERRKAKTIYDMKQSKLFGDIKGMEDGMAVNNEMLANETWNKDATPPVNVLMAQCVALGGKPIEEGKFKGYYASWGANEDGVSEWALRDPEGNAVTGMNDYGEAIIAEEVYLGTDGDLYKSNEDGTGIMISHDDGKSWMGWHEDWALDKYVDDWERLDLGDDGSKLTLSKKHMGKSEPIVVNSKNIGDLLDPGDDTAIVNMNKLHLNAYNNGLKGGEHLDNGFRRDSGAIVTSKNLRTLQTAHLGERDNTFVEDLNTQSNFSAGMYGAMAKIKGIEDVPGTSEGIDEADFAGKNGLANYNIMKDALTNPKSKNYNYSVAKEVFLDWWSEEGKAMNGRGANAGGFEWDETTGAYKKSKQTEQTDAHLVKGSIERQRWLEELESYKNKEEVVDLNFTTNTKESSIVKGGSNGYMDEVKLNNLNNFQNIINSQEPIPLNGGGSVFWDEDKGAYVNSSSGYIFKNKKELLEGLFFGGEQGEFSDDYLKSKNYTGIKDWSYSASKDDGGGGAKDLSPFFGESANEENAVEKLKIMYPSLEISSPVGMREKIKVNGTLFYLRGKGDSTPEMEMERLQGYLKTITGKGKYDG